MNIFCSLFIAIGIFCANLSYPSNNKIKIGSFIQATGAPMDLKNSIFRVKAILKDDFEKCESDGPITYQTQALFDYLEMEAPAEGLVYYAEHIIFSFLKYFFHELWVELKDGFTEDDVPIKWEYRTDADGITTEKIFTVGDLKKEQK